MVFFSSGKESGTDPATLFNVWFVNLRMGRGSAYEMKATIFLIVLGVYLVLAFLIARLCAVNAGWDKVAGVFPRKGGNYGEGTVPPVFRSGPDKPVSGEPNRRRNRIE